MTFGFLTRKSSRYSSKLKVISYMNAHDTMFKYMHLLLRFAMYGLPDIYLYDCLFFSIAYVCLLTLGTCGRKA